MRRLERLCECRALCGALLFLHLTLIGAGANARSLLASVEQVRPATVSAMASTRGRFSTGRNGRPHWRVLRLVQPMAWASISATPSEMPRSAALNAGKWCGPQ